ncbi:MAG TPA: GNAT family N-acetyltransferase [Candidatus Hydrogenedentes bacterium]|nr:GNAT family N-acetyltransferase [Candidatus Hydrogenedentota bacterium]
MLNFTLVREHRPGIIASMLVRSYAPLIAIDPDHWGGEREKWSAFDHEVFHNLDTVGADAFITCLDDNAIGFASFDSRAAPQLAHIGHNCILPGFQRRGYGTRQVDEVLRRLRERGIAQARVTTGVHPFFEPARRMYRACGFEETHRATPGDDRRYGIIEFRLELP